MNVTLIGIDLAKSVFQVCAVNQAGKPVFNRQVKRQRLLALLLEYPKAIFAIAALEQGWIPAALGADPVDPEIHLNLPSRVLEADVRFALSNAFAFGGNNASVLFERAEPSR